MEDNKKEELKREIVKSIVGSVQVIEIMQMLTSMADKEVQEQINQASEEELEKLYQDIFPES
jgi:hypothetical protein